MKYLTKEWYEAMQRTSLHLMLKPSEEARTFSEEYFLRLYAEAEREHLDFQKKVCSVDRGTMAQELFNTPITHRIDGTPVTDKEREIATAFQQALAEALHTAPPMIFDPDKEKAEYPRLFNSLLKQAKEKLPPEILQKIADIRVFALNYAAPEIIEEVAAYCKANDQYVKAASDSCRQKEKELFSNGYPDFYKKFRWHDYPIKTSHFQRNDFVLEPSRQAWPCYIFKDAEILHSEDTLENCYGLYDEIYPVDSGYEFHFLLGRSTKDGEKLFELILRCSDVVIEQAYIGTLL